MFIKKKKYIEYIRGWFCEKKRDLQRIYHMIVSY